MPKSLMIPRDDNGASYPATREQLAAKLDVDAAGDASDALDTGRGLHEPGLIALFSDVDAYYEHWNGEGSPPDPAATGLPLTAEGLKYATTPPGWKIVVKRRGGDDGTLWISYCR